MDNLYKLMYIMYRILLLIISYVFISSDLFADYILKPISGTLTADGNPTTKGEIIKCIVLVVLMVIYDMTCE